FWDMPMFHPARNTGAYSEVMLGVGPLYWPWRALGVPADTAYQLWLLGVTSLNFLVALWLLRAGFGVGRVPAVVGAVLFAAGASRLNQANHPQLLPQFYCLLAVLALLVLGREETGRRRGVVWAGVFVLACVAQLYGGFYWGWFLGFFLLLALLVALGFRDTRAALVRGLRVHGPALVVFGGLGVVALVPLARHSLEAVQEVGLRRYEELGSMIPRFLSWFHLGADSWLYGWTAGLSAFRRIPVEGEHRVGLGLVTAGVAAVALWRARGRPGVRLLLGVTVLTLLLSTRYRGGFEPWWLVFQTVPGAGAVRAVSRVGVWLLLPASLGLALFLERLERGGRRMAALVVGGVCLLEQGVSGMRFEPRESRADVEALVVRVEPGCASFLYTPAGGEFPSWKYQGDAIWAALEAGVPTVNGYSGNAPPSWRLEPILLAEPGAPGRLEAALRDWERARGLAPGAICRIREHARR
ncbi:MAG TPA: hypothetical protein VLQ93_21905, partial [Myxococcaceae bacterium]|nr:hypothetical protein [Myxococcaceae bacterium]